MTSGALPYALLLALVGCTGRASGVAAGSSTVSPDAATGPCQVLRGRLCADYGAASAVCAMAHEQAPRFVPDRCLSMLAHYPQTSIDARLYMDAKEQLNEPEPIGPHGPLPGIGPKTAPIRMVLFTDFRSPDCGRASPIVKHVHTLYPDKVRLVLRLFPSALHPEASLVAEAALAAHAQGKFWPFYDILFANPQDHSKPALIRYAKEIGLNLPTFQKAVEQHEYAADVEADRAMGKRLALGGTPALAVNGRWVPFPFGVNELTELIDASMK